MILAVSPRVIRILVITDFLIAILIIVRYLLDAQTANADFPQCIVGIVRFKVKVRITACGIHDPLQGTGLDSLGIHFAISAI